MLIFPYDYYITTLIPPSLRQRDFTVTFEWQHLLLRECQSLLKNPQKLLRESFHRDLIKQKRCWPLTLHTRQFSGHLNYYYYYHHAAKTELIHSER